MYCSKCKVDVGNEEFCEICGTKTVDKLENIDSESHRDNDKYFKMNKPSMPKMNTKSFIKIGIVAVVIIALFIGYSSLKSTYSADETAKRYINNLTEGKTEEAFKMLDIKESEFINSDKFKKYVESLDVEGKESLVRASEDENKLYGAFSNMQKQYSGVMPRDINFYKAQIESDIYSIVLIKKGKKFGLFDNWVVGSEELTKEWKIQAPKGSKVYVDGKEIKKIDEAQNFSGFNTLYTPENRIYIISAIFPNDYEITALLEGAKEIKKISNPYGAILTLGFESTQELQKELIKVAEDFVKLYYKEADKSEYKGIVHDESNFFNRSNSGLRTFKSKKFKSLEIMRSSIDDIEHAKLDISVTFDYEQEQIINFFTGDTKIVEGSSSEVFNLSFKKFDNKWVIVDTGYLY